MSCAATEPLGFSDRNKPSDPVSKSAIRVRNFIRRFNFSLIYLNASEVVIIKKKNGMIRTAWSMRGVPTKKV